MRLRRTKDEPARTSPSYGSGQEFAEAKQAERDQHEPLGRISGITGIASFCSCGLAYYGETVPEADNRRAAHQHDALGTTPTSWAV